MNDRESFRDQLLAADSMTTHVRQQLEQELRTMMIRQLSLPSRIFIGIVAVFALGSATVCGFLAVTEHSLPQIARIGLGTGVVFGLAWTAWSVKILRSGQMNLAKDPRTAAQMAWVFTVLMVTFFLFLGLSAQDRQLGILMILQSLAFLIGAAVYWLTYRIEAAELNVKEQLLRTELQITELLERQ